MSKSNNWQLKSESGNCKLHFSLVDDGVLKKNFIGYFDTNDMLEMCKSLDKLLKGIKDGSTHYDIICEFSDCTGIASDARRQFSFWLKAHAVDFYSLSCFGLDYNLPGSVNLWGALYASIERVYLVKDENEARALIYANREGKPLRNEQLETKRRREFQNMLAFYYWGRGLNEPIPTLPEEDPYYELYQATKRFIDDHSLGQIDPPQKDDQTVIQDKWEALFSQSNDGIVVFYWDTIVDCNETMLEMFGYSKKELLGHSIFEFLSPTQPDGGDSVEQAKNVVMSILSTGEAQHYYWQHQRKDGSMFDSHVTLNIIWVGADRFGMAIIQDISELMDAQKRIREQEAHIYELKIKMAKEKEEFLEQDLHQKQNALAAQAMYMMERNRILSNVLEEFHLLSNTLQGIDKRMVRNLGEMIMDFIDDKKTMEEFENQYILVNSDFYETISSRYPKLSDLEKRHLIYVKNGMTLKEIASLTGVSVKAVEMRTYRLRKKMELDSSIKLNAYLNSL